MKIFGLHEFLVPILKKACLSLLFLWCAIERRRLNIITVRQEDFKWNCQRTLQDEIACFKESEYVFYEVQNYGHGIHQKEA